MTNLKDLLENRFKKTSNKMQSLVEKRAEGKLSAFSGIFQEKQLDASEKAKLEDLLKDYSLESQVNPQDLHVLCSLSSEIKQIHHQSILLHGERIKKARDLLKNYREGAFSLWLMLTYGNRQTPYNFLVYYELYTVLSPALRIEAEKMPRQALYSLASRHGALEKKEAIIRNYKGEKKADILAVIRKEFPLAESDSRKTSPVDQAISFFNKGFSLIKDRSLFSEHEKKQLLKLIKKLENLTK